MNHNELGVYGEKIAQGYLQQKGYQHLAFNYKFGKNEVDIVSFYNNKIVVTEVKTKSAYELLEPWKAVTRNKQKQIIKVTDAYLQTLDDEYNVQFDIVSIIVSADLTSDIVHIVDAFSAM
jgi:putative endonuclease